MLCNKEGEHLINSIYGLSEYMEYLEKMLGGNGNGLCLVKDKKVIYFKKGKDFKIREAATAMRVRDYDYALFHTRLKSVGEVNDKNCHPFIEDNIVLAMNGTESDMKGIAKMLNITDTEAILKCIKKFDLDLIKTLTQFDSAFIGFKDGEPFAVANKEWGSSLKIVRDGSALVLASSFPYIFDSEEPLKFPFVWTEGSKIKAKKAAKYNYFLPKYNDSSLRVLVHSMESNEWYASDYADYYCD
jgi:hypothetical protein